MKTDLKKMESSLERKISEFDKLEESRELLEEQVSLQKAKSGLLAVEMTIPERRISEIQGRLLTPGGREEDA